MKRIFLVLLALASIASVASAQMQVIPIGRENIGAAIITNASLAQGAADSSAIIRTSGYSRMELWVVGFPFDNTIAVGKLAISVRKHLTVSGSDSLSTFTVAPRSGYLAVDTVSVGTIAGALLTHGSLEYQVHLRANAVHAQVGGSNAVVIPITTATGWPYRGNFTSVKVRNTSGDGTAIVNLKVYLVGQSGP